MRLFVAALFAIALCSFTVLADEYKGELTKIEEGKSITVKVGDKEETFTITDATKVVGGKGDVKDGFKSKMFSKLSDKGLPVTVITEKKDGKETVVEVKVGGKKKDK